ncbi:13063_t:CDS:2, partial [Racocetra fulgida]
GTPIVSSPLVKDVEESLLVDPDNELAAEELQQTLDMLYIRNPMSIEDLLDFEEERIDIHQQFSATEIEQVENEIMIQPLTGKEQLDILHNALRIVDERIDD